MLDIAFGRNKNMLPLILVRCYVLLIYLFYFYVLFRNHPSESNSGWCTNKYKNIEAIYKYYKNS